MALLPPILHERGIWIISRLAVSERMKISWQKRGEGEGGGGDGVGFKVAHSGFA